MRGLDVCSKNVPDWRELLGGSEVVDPVSGLMFDLSQLVLAETQYGARPTYYFCADETVPVRGMVRIAWPMVNARMIIQIDLPDDVDTLSSFSRMREMDNIRPDETAFMMRACASRVSAMLHKLEL